LRKSRVFRGACFRKTESSSRSSTDTTSATSNEAPSTLQVEQRHDHTLSYVPHHPLAVRITYAAVGKTFVLAKNSRKVLTTMIQHSNDDNDKVEHLILVVHGIGEMLRSVDLFGLGMPALSPITECCDFMRKNHAEVLACGSSNSSEEKPKNQEGRVEYIPVEWHEAFASYSRRSSSSSFENNSQYAPDRSSATVQMPSLRDVSLRTIPHLRAFANDTLLDVLYFLAPEYHDIMINIVTSEMEKVVAKFRTLTGRDFSGHISIVGHSLGSVISWDILAHQQTSNEVDTSADAAKAPFMGSFSDHPPSNNNNQFASTPMRRTMGIAKQAQYPQLSFKVENTFMIGSPIAVFLMIRNQHRPMSQEYTLAGCKRVFNIFHPYDPAAYRLEPLINPMFSSIEPKIVNHWKGGYRVQYQTKILWKQVVEEVMNVQRSIGETFERIIVSTGLVDSATEEENASEDRRNEDSVGNVNGGSLDEDSEGDEEDAQQHSHGQHVLRCGKLNEGRRIDYMLQEKEIEISNEYVFAIGAHSAYWDAKDLSMFIAKEIARSRPDCEKDAAPR
jgi:hypothetical protein